MNYPIEERVRVLRMQRDAIDRQIDEELLAAARSCKHLTVDVNGKDIDNTRPSKAGRYAKGICQVMGADERCITCDDCGLHVHVEKKR